MNKRLAVIVGVIVAILAIGAVVIYTGSNTGNDTASNTANDTSVNEEETAKDSHNQGASQSEQSTALPQEANAVTISDFAFDPKQITVKVGTTVTWTNQDSVQHNVKMENGSTDGPSSELLAKGESYSYTFKKAGVYNYLCTPHPYMKGTVTVTE